VPGAAAARLRLAPPLIPLKDNIPSARPPLLTIALIVVTVAVYLAGWHPDLADMPWLLAAVVATFLSGGLLQLVINMLFLWLFAKSIEDAIGPFALLVLYLLGGVAAAGAADLLGSTSSTPAIGAAGALVTVIAAYCVLCPQGRILCVVVIPFFFTLVEIPAQIVAAAWLALQLVPAIGETASDAYPGDPGVSAAALAGGLVLGLAAAAIASRGRGGRTLEPGRPVY
jgi:membrane associated rhomboid family serine protease